MRQFIFKNLKYLEYTLIGLMLIDLLVFYPKLEGLIPIHFNAAGYPDNYDEKVYGFHFSNIRYWYLFVFNDSFKNETF